MATLSDPPLRGSARITGVFFDPARGIAAVASEFPLLAVPRARAAYGGQALRYRVALYRRGESSPFAALDALRHPVNDVAFHPTESVAAIGAGSYDGGYLFEGELVAWDWSNGRHARLFERMPEVARCACDADGRGITAWVRPWDEEWEGLPDTPDAAFNTLYRVRVPYGEATWSKAPAQSPALCADDAAPEEAPCAQAAAPADRLAQWLGLPGLEQTGAIHDLAWLDDYRIAAAHRGCLLEIHDVRGGPATRYTGEGYGCEILLAAGVHVHAAAPADRSAPRGSQDSRLYRWTEDGLDLVAAYEGEFTFSASSEGMLLGRMNRYPRPQRPLDLLRDLRRGDERRLDLGHYDCFNHYLRIDGAPCLFALQGTPASSHEHKHLCVVDADGRVRRLWPVLKADGKPASHAMELCGCYLDDAQGAAVVLAGRHYSPTVGDACAGFIYRRRLDGKEPSWRHPTRASAAAIVALPQAGLVAAAFLDGTLMLMDAGTGGIRRNAKLRLEGLPTVAHAMAARGDRLALGTADGRIAVVSASELLRQDATSHWADIG